MATALPHQAVTLDDLDAALTEGWTRETSADPAAWTEQNSAWGQCAVTALVVQDHLGGSLRRGELGPISHYWNVLPSGEEIDLTRRQFPPGTEISNVASRARDYVLSNPATVSRYRHLRRRVIQHLRDSRSVDS